MNDGIESTEPTDGYTGPPPTAADALGAADAAWQDAEDEAARRRREQRVGSERIGAYAEAIRVIGDLLHPATAGDDVTPRRRPRLDPLLRGDLELALRAMAVDLRRLAGGATAPLR